MAYIPGIPQYSTTPGAGINETVPGEDVVDVADLIAYLDPDLTPFTTIIMQNRRKEATENYRFYWWIQDLLEARQIQIDATFVDNGARTQGQSIVVKIAAAYTNMLPAYVQGSLVQSEETGEVLKVSSFDTTTSELTLLGGWGWDATNTTGTAAPGDGGSTITQGTKLTLFSNSYAQGGSSPNTFNQKPTQVFNFTHIFKMKYGATGTAAASQMAWGNELTRQDFEKSQLFKLQMEEAFIRSERNVQANALEANKLESTTGGLLWMLKNITQKTGFGYVDYSSMAPVDSTTADSFLETDVFQRAFRYGKKEKVIFVSRLLAGLLNQTAKDKLRTRRDETTFGIKVSRWETIYGDANIIVHDLLPETAGSPNQGTMIIVDTDSLKYRPLIGNGLNRDVHLQRNIQLPGDDEISHMYLAEAGLQIDNPEKHFYADKIQFNL